MNLAYYFEQAIKNKASDLHLVEGSVPSLRINGELVRIDAEIISVDNLKKVLFPMLDVNIIKKFEQEKDIDFSLEFFQNRFRVNLHYQGGRIGLSARRIPTHIPSPEDVGFDETIYGLTHLRDGLILVTGPSGVGKSTTLAVMLDIINTERRSHIITIEDPVEYIFHDKQSIVEQRELGRDTNSFSQALKYALRQDPDVIMLGEMRDYETVSAALTAAKTGHLVMSTLHTSTAVETVERIVDLFPVNNQSQISAQLSSVLRAVISQQLLHRVDKGLVVAREILINNSGIANLIREGKTEQIYSYMQSGKDKKMITMNKAIDNLYNQGIISASVAHNRKRDLETKAVYY